MRPVRSPRRPRSATGSRPRVLAIEGFAGRRRPRVGVLGLCRCACESEAPNPDATYAARVSPIELVRAARQGRRDAAVPVGSWGCGARVGGGAGGGGAGRGGGGASPGAVSGDRLRQQRRKWHGGDD